MAHSDAPDWAHPPQLLSTLAANGSQLHPSPENRPLPNSPRKWHTACPTPGRATHRQRLTQETKKLTHGLKVGPALGQFPLSPPRGIRWRSHILAGTCPVLLPSLRTCPPKLHAPDPPSQAWLLVPKCGLQHIPWGGLLNTLLGFTPKVPIQ